MTLAMLPNPQLRLPTRMPILMVRAGIEAIAAVEQRRRIDRAIVDGYSRLPPTEAEDYAALAPHLEDASTPGIV